MVNLGLVHRRNMAEAVNFFSLKVNYKQPAERRDKDNYEMF